MRKRRWLVPETVQTAPTDCGPAVVKSLLEGYGIPVRYDRLREACATDVDGTSFDALETLLQRFGFVTEKSLTPPEDLLARGAELGPAIVVTRLPNGFAHFVLLWRRLGRRVLLMDPAQGCRWVDGAGFLGELFIHKMPLDAAYWRRWASFRPSFRGVIRERLRRCRVKQPETLLQRIHPDADARSIATLDAAARMLDTLLDQRAVTPGIEAQALLQQLIELATPAPERDERYIPSMYWSALPLNDRKDLVWLRGVPVLRICGLRESVARSSAANEPPGSAGSERGLQRVYGRSPEPLQELWQLLPPELRRLTQALVPLAVATALCELGLTLVLRQLLSSEPYLTLGAQRLGALGVLAACCLGVVGLDGVAGRSALLLGRQLDIRVRAQLLPHLARLPDSYFRTRAGSDLADRCHDLSSLRALPDCLLRGVHGITAFCTVLLGLIWIEPSRRGLILVLGLLALAVPVCFQRPLAALDLRARTHGGALMRFYLDALIGAVPIRTHHAHSALRHEQERLLARWLGTQSRAATCAISGELVLAFVGIALATILLFPHAADGAPRATMLLLAYWALALPALGNEFAVFVRQGTALRNQAARLLEPLSADAPVAAARPRPSRGSCGAVKIEFDAVCVKTSEHHTLLENISLCLEPGSKVAIVGASGAGKSSLLGVLLGWHRPSSGSVRIDGEPLSDASILELRRRTAWVDPTIRIWNRSLFENVALDVDAPTDRDLHQLVCAAELRDVLERLGTDGRSPLGEGDAFLSGGEGQRVRLARALCRREAGLVLLDEPFRGLDRERRARLLQLARGYWREATVLCVTHDIGETRGFDRVLVVDRGSIVEDGPPVALAAGATLYRRLLEREEAVRAALWQSSAWQRYDLAQGELHARAAE